MVKTNKKYHINLLIISAILLLISAILISKYIDNVSSNLIELVSFKSKIAKESVYDFADDLISKIDIKQNIEHVSEDLVQTKKGQTFYSKRYDDTIVNNGAEYEDMDRFVGSINIKNNTNYNFKGFLFTTSNSFNLNPSESINLKVDQYIETKNKHIFSFDVLIPSNNLVVNNGITYGYASLSCYRSIEDGKITSASLNISPKIISMTTDEIMECFLFKNKSKLLTQILTNVVSKNLTLFNKLANKVFFNLSKQTIDISVDALL